MTLIGDLAFNNDMTTIAAAKVIVTVNAVSRIIGPQVGQTRKADTFPGSRHRYAFEPCRAKLLDATRIVVSLHSGQELDGRRPVDADP